MRRLAGIMTLVPFSLSAGTGGTKDVDLAYLLLAVAFGLILLIWEGIDRLNKNRQRIFTIVVGLVEAVANFFHRLRTESV